MAGRSGHRGERLAPVEGAGQRKSGVFWPWSISSHSQSTIAPSKAGISTDRALEQMGDAFLKNLIGGEPDRVFVALRLQELVDLRVREGGIGAKEAAHLTVPVRPNFTS